MSGSYSRNMDDSGNDHSNIYPLHGGPVVGKPVTPCEPVVDGSGFDKSNSTWFLHPSYQPCPEHDVVVGSYCFHYRPEYCVYYLQRGATGLSRTAISVELGLPIQIVKHWASKIREFAVALEMSRQAAQFHWETYGQSLLGTRGFSTLGWLRMMAIQYPDDWGDDHLATITQDEPVDAFGFQEKEDRTVAASNADEILTRLLRLKSEAESA